MRSPPDRRPVRLYEDVIHMRDSDDLFSFSGRLVEGVDAHLGILQFLYHVEFHVVVIERLYGG